MALSRQKDLIDATEWPSYVVIVKLRPGFSPDKLVNWASRKGLIEVVGVHNVNIDYARKLHDELSKHEDKHFNEPEAEGDDEDIYELLGF